VGRLPRFGFLPQMFVPFVREGDDAGNHPAAEGESRAVALAFFVFVY